MFERRLEVEERLWNPIGQGNARLGQPAGCSACLLASCGYESSRPTDVYETWLSGKLSLLVPGTDDKDGISRLAGQAKWKTTTR